MWDLSLTTFATFIYMYRSFTRLMRPVARSPEPPRVHTDFVLTPRVFTEAAPAAARPDMGLRNRL